MREDPEFAQRVNEAKSRYEFTDEHRAKLSQAQMGHEVTPETREKIAAAQRGKKRNGEPAVGYSIWEGYRILSGQQDHPLASPRGRGALAEHRVILYDKLGPGPHPCHWCGTMRDWGGGTEGIYVDHLDRDGLNNDPDNLVPSCFLCNWNRDNSHAPAGQEGS
jgi:hypothetical protein